MREIKFRAKAGTQWRYGDLYHNERGELVIYEPKTSGQTLEGKAVNGWRIVVDPETVGQYVGLKDSEGREIYEGDVIRVCGSNGIVVYSEGAFIVRFEKAPSLLSHCVGGYFSNPERVSACRVIGNVYDNPELLERKP